ncbi:unnamed protein product [Parnassius apollo]|uniref:Pro-corazonin n=1 Tax=Parnassius apollo TaxID=110799 RepID=A0A8S3WLU2_PARAO|nr:unnamed protein product [Parnassius apollo]
MSANITIFLVFVTVSTVTAQTFQYSRGWTNGKRDGHRKEEVISSLERVFGPCQMRKLKYLLEGKPLNDRFYAPCDYFDEEPDAQSKRYKPEHNQDNLFEIFQ